MKLLLCFFIIFGFANVVRTDESVDIYLTMCMENFAVAMRTGIPELGMPILDPLFIPYISIPEISQPKLKFNANASNSNVWDHSYYVPKVHTELGLSYISVKMNLTQVKVNGTYWCDGMAMRIFPIFGDGFYTLDVLDIFIDGEGGLVLTPDGYLQILDLHLNLTFNELIVYFDNFLGGGSFGDEVNEALGELGKLFFETMLPILNNKILPILVEYLNTVLLQNTLMEIIQGALPSPP